MVFRHNSYRCRFTVHYTGKSPVFSDIFYVLNSFGMEPAWRLIHTHSKRTFRLDVGLIGADPRAISAVAGRIGKLDGVKKVQVAMPGRTFTLNT